MVGLRIRFRRGTHRDPILAHDFQQMHRVGERCRCLRPISARCYRRADLLEEPLGHTGGRDDKQNPPRRVPAVPVAMKNPRRYMHDGPGGDGDRTGLVFTWQLPGEVKLAREDIEGFLRRLGVQGDAPAGGTSSSARKYAPRVWSPPSLMVTRSERTWSVLPSLAAMWSMSGLICASLSRGMCAGAPPPLLPQRGMNPPVGKKHA